MSQFIEPLEGRKLLAADLSVAITSTTLADSLTLDGKKPKPSIAVVTVSNTGDAIDKKNKGNVAVTVALRDGQGALTQLGSGNVKANKLGKANVKLNVSASVAAGSYTLVATVAGGTAVPEDNTANNTATGKTFTVTDPNSGGGGGGGSTTDSPLNMIGLGNKITFKKTKSGGFGGIGYEDGNWSDNAGHSGSYHMTVGTGITNGGCALTNADGTPRALVKFNFASGKPKLGNSTLTFGVAGTGALDVAGQSVAFTTKK